MGLYQLSGSKAPSTTAAVRMGQMECQAVLGEESSTLPKSGVPNAPIWAVVWAGELGTEPNSCFETLAVMAWGGGS